MLFFLLSTIGIIGIDRFVSRLESFKLIDKSKKILWMLFFNLPSVFFLIFKDHLLIFIIYIGLILLSLMFLGLYFDYLLKKTFLSAEIRVLEIMNLQIKSGKSPLQSAKITFEGLNLREKIVFEPLLFLKSDLKVPIYAKNNYMNSFFTELNQILQSQIKICDQIDQYKNSLRIKKNLRHKSRLAAVQVRAQTIISIFIYLFLMMISFYELQLAKFPILVAVSGTFLFLGIWIILIKGSKIKWTI